MSKIGNAPVSPLLNSPSSSSPIVPVVPAVPTDGSDQSIDETIVAPAAGESAREEVIAEPRPPRPLNETMVEWQPGGRIIDEVYDFEEFVDLVERAEEEVGNLEDMESTTAFRQDHSSRDQEKAIYGRVSFEFGKHLFGNLFSQIGERDVFLDIGHGVGNLVLQAAFMRGCWSRGIEISRERFDCSVALSDECVRIGATKRNLRHGKVSLCHGKLQDPDHRHFLSGDPVDPNGRSRRRTRYLVFCNNFNGAFGERATPAGSTTLSTYIAGLFTQMPIHSELVVFDPLHGLPPSLTEANETRWNHSLPRASDASFYELVKTVEKEGSKYLDWLSTGEITIYRYKKLSETAKFRCGNSGCPSDELMDAFSIDSEGRVIPVAHCSHCNMSPRFKRRRRR